MDDGDRLREVEVGMGGWGLMDGGKWREWRERTEWSGGDGVSHRIA